MKYQSYYSKNLYDEISISFSSHLGLLPPAVIHQSKIMRIYLSEISLRQQVVYKLPKKKVWESVIDRYYWFPRNFNKLHLRKEEFRNGLSCNACNYEYLEEKAWHLHGRLDGLIMLFRFYYLAVYR